MRCHAELTEWVKRSLLAAATVLFASCAHTYVDSEGKTHVIGLVHIVVPKPADAAAGTALRIRSAGVSFYTSPARSAFTLGFNDDTIVQVNANSCVALDPVFRLISQASTTSPDQPLVRSKP